MRKVGKSVRTSLPASLALSFGRSGSAWTFRTLPARRADRCLSETNTLARLPSSAAIDPSSATAHNANDLTVAESRSARSELRRALPRRLHMAGLVVVLGPAKRAGLPWRYRGVPGLSGPARLRSVE